MVKGAQTRGPAFGPDAGHGAAPPGQFARNDLNQYTVAEAIWILNHDLERVGYRVLRQGDFLMVMDLDGLRSDHQPSIARRSREDDPDSANGVRPVSATEAVPQTPQEQAVAAASEAENEEISKRRVRIWYSSTAWSTVLPKFAEEAGLILVMKRCPVGTFHHPDWGKLTVPEAIAVMNRALDDTSFRIVRQDKFLVVLFTEDLRTEYERPVVGQRRIRVPQAEDTPLAPEQSRSGVRQVSNEELWNSRSAGNIPASLDPGRSADPENGPILLNADANVPEATGPPAATATRALETKRPEPLEEPSAPVQSSVFVPQHGRAATVAQQLYRALKPRAELITPGLQGLPSFRVIDVVEQKKAKSPDATSFTIGFDADHNRLVIEGRPRHLRAAVHLCERLDSHSDGVGLPIQLVSADADTCAVAKSLAPELDRLQAQRGPVEMLAQAGSAGGNQSGATSGAAQGGNQPTTGQVQLGQPGPGGQKGISEIIKGLKGDVTVESVPELGILILRGGQSDVEAVMKVIREIERLSAVATPSLHFLPLQYVNSESFATLVNDIYKALATARTAEGGGKQFIQVFPLAKPNAVLVLAPETDMPQVMKLANQLDQPVNPELEFQVFRLRYGYAATVARSVSEFYKSPKALGTSVNVFADPRTNSIIVQARPRDLAEVGRLIDKLDAPTASTATIKVFPLSNGDATSIARLLETLFGTGQNRTGQQQQQQQQQQQGAEGSGEAQAPTALRLSVDVRTNSIIALGPPDTLRAVEAVIVRLDNSDVHQRETTVIRLKNNAADNVAQAITNFVRSQRELQQIDPEAMSNIELLEREVFVVSESVSNSLLLSATPRYFSQLKQMIDKLDAPPAQVIIQALLVEVELDNTDEFGIELGLQSPVLFDRSTISSLQLLPTTTTLNPTTTISNNVLLSSTATPGFQFSDPTTYSQMQNPISPSQVGGSGVTSLGVGRTSPNVQGVSGLVLSASSDSVTALLRALSYKRTLHVLSRPQIRTLDNRLASIQVGQRVPIIAGATVNPLGNLQPIVQYDNAGIILTVQPRITPDGMIALEAYAEKSQYEATGLVLASQIGGSTLTSPIKDITRAESSVNVASGNTVVMGGMITSTDTTVTSKVPWLGDVPIMGQFFRYDSRTTKRTELLIFLTPRVIRDDADDEMIKQIETERIHFLVDEAEGIHGPILSTRPPALEECPPEGMPVSPVLTPGSPLTMPAEMAPPPSPSGTPGGVMLMPPSPRMQPPVPSTAPAPAGPAAPAAPGTAAPQRAPVLPPPAMPPVGSRPADQAGTVRSVTFEESAVGSGR